MPNNSVDIVICSEVLEHLHEYNDAINEIHRVLKPGGKFMQVYQHLGPKRYVSFIKRLSKSTRRTFKNFNQKSLIEEIKISGFNFLHLKNFTQFIVHIGGLDVFGSLMTKLFVNKYKSYWKSIFLKNLNLDSIDKSLNPIMGKFCNVF